jgi:hypothetical protein
MAVVVASELTTLDAMEATTNYTVHNINGSMGSLKALSTWMTAKNGSNVGMWACDAETGGYYYDNVGDADHSANHFWVWGIASEPWELSASTGGTYTSGVFLMGYDGTNFGYWYVDGNDTYFGSWRNWVVYLGNTPDGNDGANPNMASTNGLGLGFELNAASKATYNCFMDYLRTGNGGIKVTTTSSSVATWASVLSGDESIAVGILRQEAGIYYARGPITFGDTGAGDMEFADTSEVIIFEDVPVSTTLYKILVQGGVGTVEFKLGTKAGTRGIQGCILKCNATTLAPEFTATDTDIDVLQLYGCTFDTFGTITLPAVSGTDREGIDTNFVNCGEVQASTYILTYCNFIDAPDGGDGVGALRLSSTSHNVTYCNFINCATAIHINTAGSYGASGLNCNNCTNDVDNSVNATDYSTSVVQDSTQVISGDVTNDAVAQSFTGSGGTLANAVFYLKKTGSPTGVATARVYAHTGVYGTSSTPTGSALAVSEDFDVTTLTGTYAEYRFRFIGDNNIVLGNGTDYCVSIEYTVAPGGGNTVDVGYDVSGGHGGNMAVRAVSGGAWTAQAGDDAYHKVRTGGIVIINATAGTGTAIDQDKTIETGTPPGSTTVVNTVTLKVTCKDEWDNLLEGIRVRLEKSSDGSQITQGTTSASGVYQDDTYNYPGSDVNIDVIARLKGYDYIRTSGVISSTGFTIILTMVEDDRVNLP